MNILVVFLIFSIQGGLFMEKGKNGGFELSEKGFLKFMEELKSKVAPLDEKIALAEWNAAVTGKSEYFKESEKYTLERAKIFRKKEYFNYLKALKDTGVIKDKILKRVLTVLYNDFLQEQIDPELKKEIVKLESEIQKIYYNFRTEFKGKKLTKNEVVEILKTSKDINERKEVWIAQKKIGEKVESLMKKLVSLRNRAAKKLGFKNFYEMRLYLSEQDPKQLVELFEKLDKITSKPFKKIKDWIDNALLKRYGLKKGTPVYPWFYEDLYFQETPSVFKVNLDKYYKNVDIVTVAKRFYHSIGMETEDILKRSSLYEQKGKNQHAFCTTINPDKKDIRILTNIKKNERWMDTTLHELGHAVYDKYISKDLPYFLKTPSHMFTTEAVAMTFGKLAHNPYWMEKNIGLSHEEAEKIAPSLKKYLKISQLIFARWVLVMVNFEKSMYENPDQDLNKLWWDLKEKYQFEKRPENRNKPDWATKDHICLYPVYYHNYLLGELMSAQVHDFIARNIEKKKDLFKVHYTGNKKVGEYFIKRIFEPGASLNWNELIKEATGEYLNPDYFIKRYVE